MATPHDRLGSTRTQCVDVRLVAATSRNLEQMVRGKQFREDLYFRLNVFPIRIPPLRELQNLIERAVILSHGPVLRVPLQDLDNRTAGIWTGTTAG
jgi:transcriptional regulator with GAF, ATPase, and Fis domain